MHYYTERFIVPPSATASDVDAALLNQIMSAVMTAIDASGRAAKERAFDKAFSVMVSSLLDSGISHPIALQTARRVDRSAKFALHDYGLPVSARQQMLRQRQNNCRLARARQQQPTARSAFNGWEITK